MDNIVNNLMDDCCNFRCFLKGLRDSYVYNTRRKISKKQYEKVLEFVSFIYTKNKYLCFGKYNKCIFITCNEKKINMVEKYSKFVLHIVDRIILNGWFLDIPICCVKAYIKDFVREFKKNRSCLEGRDPAKRYLKQLKKLKIKDKFEVEVFNDAVNYFGFIPCNPKCKKALRVLKKRKNDN